MSPAPDSQTKLAELQQIVHDLLEEARHQGASAAEAGVSDDAGLSVTVRLGEVETVERTRDHSLGVTVYFSLQQLAQLLQLNLFRRCTLQELLKPPGVNDVLPRDNNQLNLCFA